MNLEKEKKNQIILNIINLFISIILHVFYVLCLAIQVFFISVISGSVPQYPQVVLRVTWFFHLFRVNKILLYETF